MLPGPWFFWAPFLFEFDILSRRFTAGTETAAEAVALCLGAALVT